MGESSAQTGIGTDTAPLVSDAELIYDVTEGDHLAFLTLHNRYQRRCIAVARHVLGGADGVADVVQSVFLDLWRQSRLYDAQRGSVGGWLLAAAHHRAVDYVRREEGQRGRALRAAQFGAVAHSAPDPATEVLRAAEQDRVATALTTLSARQREVLILAYYGGLTQQQIADKLAIPLGTVKGRARSGLESLGQALLDT